MINVCSGNANKTHEEETKVKNERALHAFMANICWASERLAELTEYIENHMDTHPDEINWGHVGTSGYFVERLSELTDCAFKRGEYTN